MCLLQRAADMVDAGLLKFGQSSSQSLGWQQLAATTAVNRASAHRRCGDMVAAMRVLQQALSLHCQDAELMLAM